jgi:hypothetical protein
MSAGAVRHLAPVKKRGYDSQTRNTDMIARKSSALRLAPPTRAPSTPGIVKSAAAFPGFTEPP